MSFGVIHIVTTGLPVTKRTRRLTPEKLIAEQLKFEYVMKMPLAPVKQPMIEPASSGS